MKLEHPQGRCRFGFARADITPSPGIYHRMWGAAKHEQATGVHRPLLAGALFFQSLDQNEEFVLVTLDHCLLWANDMAEMNKTVSSEAGVDQNRLVVAFSHTHAAGLMDTTRAHLPGGDRIAPYLKEVARTVARIIKDARSNAQNARLTYGSGKCSLARHRDFWDEQSEQFVCGFNPDGPADDTVTIVRIEDDAGTLLATVVNYACHPTTLAWDNTLISPDFVGAMREVVEMATGAPCFFLQGASGDLGPKVGFVGDVDVADRNGRQLGFAVLSAFEGLPPSNTLYEYTGPVVSGATIGTWSYRSLDEESLRKKADWRFVRTVVELPYKPDLPKRSEVEADKKRWREEEEAARREGDWRKAGAARAMVERMDRSLARMEGLPAGPNFPMPVFLTKIGDGIWLAVEGEHYQAFQKGLRERFPRTPIVVMTLANGSRPSYLPTAETYGKGIYQETVAMLAPGSLEKLTEAVTASIASLLNTED
ncbi:MAG: hypothetical protein KatS3mg105_3536 [Gemmatales bacterium]|nr:MAG: hypothetical protein KatS3mg105_3536 [Gemmatales bacterium]